MQLPCDMLWEIRNPMNLSVHYNNNQFFPIYNIVEWVELIQNNTYYCDFLHTY